MAASPSERRASLETYVQVLEDLLAEANLRCARVEAVLRDMEAGATVPNANAAS